MRAFRFIKICQLAVVVVLCCHAVSTQAATYHLNAGHPAGSGGEIADSGTVTLIPPAGLNGTINGVFGAYVNAYFTQEDAGWTFYAALIVDAGIPWEIGACGTNQEAAVCGKSLPAAFGNPNQIPIDFSSGALRTLSYFYDFAGFSGTELVGLDLYLQVPDGFIISTPLPSSVLLFASAVGGAGVFGWRRKKG